MEFVAPLGVLGKLAEELMLAPHMRHLLERRNRCIRETAGCGDWKAYPGG